MLSSSPSKIHEPLVTGVSPRLTDRRQRQKLRNTSRSLWVPRTPVTVSEQRVPAGATSTSPSRREPA